MGGFDRIIRIIIALVIGILFWQDILTGTVAFVLLIFASVFLLTSFMSYCPLYNLVGISTCSKK